MDAPPDADPRAAVDARVLARRDAGDLDGATALETLLALAERNA